MSRTRVQALAADGRVQVDGRLAAKSYRVSPGERITVAIPPLEATRIVPEPIQLDILYEDEDLCVVDKPAGMVTHPAPAHRSGTLVNALMHAVHDLSGVGGRLRPGIVHRLDKNTSGLLVVAKEDGAHRVLQAALARREIRRIYLAAAWGRLSDSPIVVDAPIGRHSRDRKRMAVAAGGRPAETRFTVLESWRRAELLQAELSTGRTHQIRVHLAHIGHPVVSDDTYGAGWERGMGGPQRRWAMELARVTPRQFLHACRLEFNHPRTGKPMSFQSSLPRELDRVRNWARSTSGSSRISSGSSGGFDPNPVIG